jgi:hypothetical protein
LLDACHEENDLSTATRAEDTSGDGFIASEASFFGRPGGGRASLRFEIGEIEHQQRFQSPINRSGLPGYALEAKMNLKARVSSAL